MKKIMFVVVLLFGLGTVIHAEKQVFIEIVGSQPVFNYKKVRIHIDFGQEVKLSNIGEQLLVDNTGKSIVFNSMTASLNYMGALGWKFVQAYAVTVGKQNVYHYIMTKTIQDDSEIYDGIMTREMFNKLEQ